MLSPKSVLLISSLCCSQCMLALSAQAQDASTKQTPSRSVRSVPAVNLGNTVPVRTSGKKGPLPEIRPLVLTGKELQSAQISVYFGPGIGPADAVVKEVNSAKKSIKIESFQLTSPPIMAAVLAAQKRGVQVFAIIDESNIRAYEGGARYLVPPLIQIFGNSKYESINGNVILIDDQIIITGAYRLSLPSDDAASTSLLIIKNAPALATAFTANFSRKLGDSKEYVRPSQIKPTAVKQTGIVSADVDKQINDYIILLNDFSKPVTDEKFIDERENPAEKFPTLKISSSTQNRYIGSTIILRWMVDMEGVPNNIVVIKGSGNAPLNEKAISLVKAKKFKPRVGGDGRRQAYAMMYQFPVKDRDAD